MNDIHNFLILKYETIANCIELASREIYSRFTGMLTANSIIAALIGIVLSGKVSVSVSLTVILSTLGIILCIFWLLLNCHGIHWQHRYMDEAKKLETEIQTQSNYAEFKIWSLGQRTSLQYSWISTCIIAMFIIMHVVLICAAIFSCNSK